jgi:hypothetical protein
MEKDKEQEIGAQVNARFATSNNKQLQEVDMSLRGQECYCPPLHASVGIRFVQVQNLDIVVLLVQSCTYNLKRTRNRCSIFLTNHITYYTLPVYMAHFKFSNVIINGSTFNSAQGGFHINDRDSSSESGMHLDDFGSVQKRILIDHPM